MDEDQFESALRSNAQEFCRKHVAGYHAEIRKLAKEVMAYDLISMPGYEVIFHWDPSVDNEFKQVFNAFADLVRSPPCFVVDLVRSQQPYRFIWIVANQGNLPS